MFSIASLIHQFPPSHPHPHPHPCKKRRKKQLPSASNRQSLYHFNSKDLMSMEIECRTHSSRVQNVPHLKLSTWMTYKYLKGKMSKRELPIVPHTSSLSIPQDLTLMTLSCRWAMEITHSTLDLPPFLVLHGPHVRYCNLSDL